MTFKEHKKRFTFSLNPKIVGLIDEELLKRLGVKSRSAFAEKALMFVLSNEETFVKVLEKEKWFEEEYRKAYDTRDKQKFMELFLIDPFKIKNSISP